MTLLELRLAIVLGHNWWCVMFPTLCFVDVSSGSLDDDSKVILESSLDQEEFDLISKDDTVFNFKFKIVEFFEDIKIALASI